MVGWLRKTTCENGVEYIQNKVVDISLEGNHVRNITLQSGEEITTSTLVNAAGIRAYSFSRLEGKDLPIEARRRYTYIFSVTDAWNGHYRLNTFDHNAIIGPLNEVSFLRGLSGHGSQQALACGRCVAELAVHGEYQTLDLSEIRYERIAENRPPTEQAVI
ncbi:uncharacterized protein NFIA_048910 [Aspergillus fischeri NRRL 181]|uniref:FAD dependent oxidoreductase domain-containing protein n=1 Tax=Neosartorya fischeri (strain ATCC 1020 / DSM 3700 / CBS 544.65 / FGSC A1164 / JCM 1740 / NRRL 181 / WB 181) TaxID=331117 RepID=A1DL82_NEOFI|nr:uncharacterized protein NFIA_048910 [Aspergillus fischeri NRRL 181]EAW15553.1 hypothetical protein NFIA_048910 [Aspergillus fischeri NRRL 181]